MAMTYTTLTGDKTVAGSILNFVNYKKVPVDVVLEEAQALIFARLRVREMRVSGTLTLSTNTAMVALPARFLEPIVLRDRHGISLIPNHGDRWTYVSEAELMEKRFYDDSGNLPSGIPCAVAIFDESYQFDLLALTARTYDHIFYRRPDLLSSGNPSNFLTDRYPHILRIACLAGAASYMKDDAEEQKQLAKLIGFCDEANAEADLSRAR